MNFLKYTITTFFITTLLILKISAASVIGTVIDAESGEPLSGVNVLVKGTFIGSATDAEGYFQIENLPEGQHVIIADMMGFKSNAKQVAFASIKEKKDLEFELVAQALQGETITVTATGVPILYEKSPMKTSVVTSEMIELQQSDNLASVLALQTGVRVENNCQNCNFTQVRLNGLEGRYSQILIDGDPVVSNMAGVYGLEQLPAEMIEKVEVIKGGASSLYGSSAVAGVVNMITKLPSHNHMSAQIKNSFIDGNHDIRGSFVAETINNKKNAGLFIFGVAENRDPVDMNEDDFSEVGELKSKSFGLNAFYDLAKNKKVTLHGHVISEDRRGGNKFKLKPHEADIAESIETSRYGASVKFMHNYSNFLKYQAYTSFAYQERDTYYGAGQDPNAYGYSENPLSVSGLKVNYQHKMHLVTAGVQYNYETLLDEAKAYNRIIDDEYSNLGLLLQDHMTFGSWDNYEVIAGVRFDKHSKLNDFVISPRLLTRLEILGGFAIRASVSTGFKAPEIFDEDLHITQVGGEGQVIRNSDNLKEENSYSISGGFEFNDFVKNTPFKFDVNVFYTHLDKAFMLDEQDDPLTDEVEFYRVNGTGAEITGVEFDFGIKPTANIEIRSGITIQESSFDEGDADFGYMHFFRSPDHYGHFQVLANTPFNSLLSLEGNYTGSMHVPHYAGYIAEDRLEKTNDFMTYNIGLSLPIPIPVSYGHLAGKLNLRVNNIFNEYQNDLDKGIDRDAGYVYGPAMPRTVSAEIKIEL